MSSALLRLSGVGRRYGEHQALLAVNLTVGAGECVVLVGQNGSGKSTLLRIAAGREAPSCGEVRFDGHVLSEEDPRTRARIAVVDDAGACYPDLTVREHLMLVAIAHGLGRDSGDRVDRVLVDRGLGECRDRLPSSLSAGQFQSVLLAAALVRPHQLLIMDEPEQHLDPAARRRLAQVLIQEKSEAVALLLATHDMELARTAADHVLALDDGRVVQRASPTELFRDMGHD